MSQRVAIKICGLTTVAQVEEVVSAGADAVGVVLCASPRQVDLSRARLLFQAIPPEVLAVAVFRDVSQAQALAAVKAGARAVQAMGGWRGALPDHACWLPALRDGEPVDDGIMALVHASTTWPERWPARVLLDGPRPGSGLVGDWERAARAAKTLPVALAGGLSPDTVATAIRRVRPVAVDVSSGVEAAPGIKDPARVAAFVAAVRAQEVV